jgi:hypothetical protein
MLQGCIYSVYAVLQGCICCFVYVVIYAAVSKMYVAVLHETLAYMLLFQKCMLLFCMKL